MKLPKDYKVSLEEICFDGLFRPKFFLAVSVESKDAGFEVTQYVKGSPFLLRIRLALALRRCIKMLRKYKKFTGKQEV